MRTRSLAIGALVLLSALAPLSVSARAAAPVLSASSAGDYVFSIGTSCATLVDFDVYDSSAPAISVDAAVFGVTGASPVNMSLSGFYLRDTLGQRVFHVDVSATVLADGQYVSVYWEGQAALKCLSGGAMQFSFKPAADSYFMSPVGVMQTTGCGDLGGNARLIATVNPTTGAFSFDVYAPVIPHPHVLDDCAQF